MKFNKALEEGYTIENFAATSTHDVQGVQALLVGTKKKKKGDKIVRRVIKNPITYIGTIKI